MAKLTAQQERVLKQLNHAGLNQTAHAARACWRRLTPLDPLPATLANLSRYWRNEYTKANTMIDLESTTHRRGEVFANTIYSVDCPYCNSVQDFHSQPSNNMEYECIYCGKTMQLDTQAI